MQSSASGYSYPVVVALPASAGGLCTPVRRRTSTSRRARCRTWSPSRLRPSRRSALSAMCGARPGTLTRKVIKVGMVGDEYTQVLSGLSPGQSVVLADYAEAVPSSNTETNTFGGLGGLGGGGFGGGGFGGGGGTFRARRRGRRASGADSGARPSNCRRGGRPRPWAVRWRGGSDPPGPGESRRAATCPPAAPSTPGLGLDFGDEPDPVWDAHHVSARHGDDARPSTWISTA